MKNRFLGWSYEPGKEKRKRVMENHWERGKLREGRYKYKGKRESKEKQSYLIRGRERTQRNLVGLFGHMNVIIPQELDRLIYQGGGPNVPSKRGYPTPLDRKFAGFQV